MGERGLAGHGVSSGDLRLDLDRRGAALAKTAATLLPYLAVRRRGLFGCVAVGHAQDARGL